MEDPKKESLPLAYLNNEFLETGDARPLRILSEYLEPAARMRRLAVRDTIVFFGSARCLPPDTARERLELLKSRIATQELTSEVAAQIERAEHGVRLAEYYQSARELARRVTEWSKSTTGDRHFIVCSGGSGGIMEAANRGASEARGKTIGLNIHLPFEQEVNPYVTRELTFNFRYFFMRKLWFVYPAKALVVFPGGFGTCDELFEVLTLIQTRKPRKSMPVVLFGREFWDEVVDLNAMVRWGTISPEDLDILFITDSVDEAFDYLRTRLEELYLTPPGLEEVKLT